MINWREKLVEMRERFETEGENYKIKPDEALAALNFKTCAVGEQRELYPDIIEYSFHCEGSTVLTPVDRDLYYFGIDFYSSIMGGHFNEAERYLDLIEQRVLELKRNHTDGDTNARTGD